MTPHGRADSRYDHVLQRLTMHEAEAYRLGSLDRARTAARVIGDFRVLRNEPAPAKRGGEFVLVYEIEGVEFFVADPHK